MVEPVTASGDDPYRTAELRRRVLAAWADAPTRFREDANAEEDFALGGYRDRVVVELAQNAADAAYRAKVPGRLSLTLDGDRLVAANNGAPLTPGGVESLATLRAVLTKGQAAHADLASRMDRAAHILATRPVEPSGEDG